MTFGATEIIIKTRGLFVVRIGKTVLLKKGRALKRVCALGTSIIFGAVTIPNFSGRQKDLIRSAIMTQGVGALPKRTRNAEI